MEIVLTFLILALSFSVILFFLNRITKFPGFVLVGIATIFWMVFLMWGSFLNSWAFGFSAGRVVFFITCLLALIVAIGISLAGRNDHKRSQRKSSKEGLRNILFFWLSAVFLGIKNNWLEIALVISICVLIGSLLHTRLLPNGPEGVYSGGSTWADLSLHTAIITHFAHGNQVNFDNPIYSGTPNVYPWMFDFYTAWLVQAGFSLRWALLISSWQTLLGLALVFVAICKQLNLKKVGSIAATCWFFLAGGLGFVYVFPDKIESGLTWLQFLQKMPVQYANDPTRGIYFSTPITDILLPQRGALVGLGVVLAILILLGAWLKTLNQTQIVLACILCGLLPMIHVHLFLAALGFFMLAGVMGCRKRTTALSWAAGLFVIILLSLPQLHWMTASGQSHNFIQLDLLWMYEGSPLIDQIGFVRFLLLNFSVVFAVALASWPLTRKQPHTGLRQLLYIGMIGILVISLIFRFQPNPYDNIKFLVVALLCAALLAGSLADMWWKQRHGLVIFLIIIGTLSGGLSTIREYFHSFPFASTAEVQAVTDVSMILPAGSVLATAPHHHLFLNNMGGYAVYMAYPGWLWTHGIEYSDRTETLQRAYAGNQNAINKLMHEGVTHLVISAEEQRYYQIDPVWNEQPSVFSSPLLRIYNLENIRFSELPKPLH